MEFKREYYINKLINKQNNGMIKVITKHPIYKIFKKTRNR